MVASALCLFLTCLLREERRVKPVWHVGQKNVFAGRTGTRRFVSGGRRVGGCRLSTTETSMSLLLSSTDADRRDDHIGLCCVL